MTEHPTMLAVITLRFIPAFVADFRGNDGVRQQVYWVLCPSISSGLTFPMWVTTR